MFKNIGTATVFAAKQVTNLSHVTNSLTSTAAIGCLYMEFTAASALKADMKLKGWDMQTLSTFRSEVDQLNLTPVQE